MTFVMGTAAYLAFPMYCVGLFQNWRLNALLCVWSVQSPPHYNAVLE